MHRFRSSSFIYQSVKLLFGLRSPLRCFTFSALPTHGDIIHLILQQKSAAEALKTFRWASEIPDFRHNQCTYKAVIQKLCAFRQFQTVDNLLEEMPSTVGSPPDESIFLTIVRGYGHAGKVKKAIGVLDSVCQFGRKPSLKLFNSILDVLVREDIDLAKDFFREQMIGNGFEGDDYTFGILMKGLCSTNRVGDGFKLLSSMKSRGLKPNTVIYNTLIHSLCRLSKVGRARSLMREMVEPNDVTFNIMISAYCKEGNIVLALVMLEKCFKLGFVPDIITVTKVIDALCCEGRVMEAVDLMETVEEKKGSVADVVAYNSLVKGFCVSGKVKAGVRLLKEMERKGCLPNLNTYILLINGFCELGDLDSALDLFREMGTVGIGYNFITYDMLIKGLCSGGRIAHGFKLLSMVEENTGGFIGRIGPYNSILYGLYRENKWHKAHMFLTEMEKYFPRTVYRSFRIFGLCKEGKFEEAMEVYDEMVNQGDFPSALVYACMIKGLCEKGEVREAFELLNEMVVKAYFPIKLTFNSLIAAFCRIGEVGGASTLLEEMNRRGCTPDEDSYSPLIDAFCRRGNFQRASALLVQLVEMGIVPSHTMWNSLLLSLRQGKNSFHLLTCLTGYMRTEE